MFKKNDKALLTTRIITLVVIGILAVGSFIMGIVLAEETGEGVLFLTTFAGWFLCWLLWVAARLYLSYLCDIKLIRNKLYGESNEGLEVFLKAREERSNSPVLQKKKKEAAAAELAHLQQLLDSGVITEDEFNARKNDLTTGE